MSDMQKPEDSSVNIPAKIRETVMALDEDEVTFLKAYMTVERNQESMVTLLAKPPEHILNDFTANVYKVHLNHMAVGISKEAGELLDAISRIVHYGNKLDDFWKKENKTYREVIKEELGDIEFYLQGMRDAIGVTRIDVLISNQRKLMDPELGRYKEGKFSNKAANARADKEVETKPKEKPPMRLKMTITEGQNVILKKGSTEHFIDQSGKLFKAVLVRSEGLGTGRPDEALYTFKEVIKESKQG